jgi:hypothetical protein
VSTHDKGDLKLAAVDGFFFFCGSQKIAWQRKQRIWQGNNDQNLDKIIDISLLLVFLGRSPTTK